MAVTFLTTPNSMNVSALQAATWKVIGHLGTGVPPGATGAIIDVCTGSSAASIATRMHGSSDAVGPSHTRAAFTQSWHYTGVDINGDFDMYVSTPTRDGMVDCLFGPMRYFY